MIDYTVKYTKNNKIYYENIKAPSPKEALREINIKKLGKPLSATIQKQQSLILRLYKHITPKIKRGDLILFFSSLLQLYQSNITLVDAIKITLNTTPSKRFRAILQSVLHSLSSGKSLYLAFKDYELEIPKNTYVSVPQSIIHAGFKPTFKDIKWKKFYQIGDLPVYDYAVGFESGIYKSGTFQCLSFQQKKCLNIGKGGAILTDDYEAYKILKRLSWDGRDASIPVQEDKNIILGFHMNMIPDDAAKGILLLNQLNKKRIKDYL